MRLTRACGTALAIAAALLAGCGSGDEGPPPGGGKVGVNLSRLMEQQPDEARLARHLDAIRATGVRLVRHDAAWQLMEPQPGRLDFAFYDRFVTALARRGLRWLPIVDYSTTWSTSTPGNVLSPPLDTAAFERFASALARRYGRGGRFWREHPDLPALAPIDWEIWNEPNLTFFWGGLAPDPTRYADLYLGGRAAIKAADPRARTILGPLAGSQDAYGYLTAMYAARPQLRGAVDAVGWHPYGGGAGEVFDKVRRMRATVDRVASRRVPLALTEFGWPVLRGAEAPWSQGESHRAAELERVVRTFADSDCNVSLVVPHTWATAERDAAQPEDWFGLADPVDGSPRPGSEALRTAVEGLGRPARQARVCS